MSFIQADCGYKKHHVYLLHKIPKVSNDEDSDWLVYSSIESLPCSEQRIAYDGQKSTDGCLDQR